MIEVVLKEQKAAVEDMALRYTYVNVLRRRLDDSDTASTDPNMATEHSVSFWHFRCGTATAAYRLFGSNFICIKGFAQKDKRTDNEHNLKARVRAQRSVHVNVCVSECV